MMNTRLNKITAMLISIIICLVMFSFVPKIEEESSAYGMDNITARADYLYNLTWTAKKSVSGWRNCYTFNQGNTYHIPYGQPVTSGKYICWGVSVSDFLTSTQDVSNVFYSKRSYYSGNSGSYSTYYAMDCSAFASYCWDLPGRTTTAGWSKLNVTSYGICNSSNVGKIQRGDALNLANSHVVIISRVNSDGTYEVTEQTPPQIKRTVYTASQLVAKYGAYTIYRYNNRNSVSPPPIVPIVDSEKPSITNVYLSEINTESFRVVCEANDNIGIDRVEMATWTTSNQSDLIWRKATFNGVASWFVDIPRSDYRESPDVYITHLYVYDTQNNLTTTEIMYWRDTEVPEITNKYISEVKAESFRVVCDVADNDGIGTVKIATWTTGDQSDLIWRDAQFNGVSSYFVDIPISAYRENPEVYISHIYVYDNCGNATAEEIVYQPDYSGPNISDVYLSEITDTSFRVVARVSDSKGISSVKIATWSTADQSDLVWREAACNGYNDYFVDIPVNEHQSNPDIFISHIYAYNSQGILSTKEILYWYKYTIEFDSNGGSCFTTNKIVTHGGTYGELPKPTRTGYKFKGWFTSESGGEQITFETKVAITENQTLYAQWEKNTTLGDCNDDGLITITDAVILQKYLLYDYSFDKTQWTIADITKDGTVNGFDLAVLKQILLEAKK